MIAFPTPCGTSGRLSRNLKTGNFTIFCESNRDYRRVLISASSWLPLEFQVVARGHGTKSAVTPKPYDQADWQNVTATMIVWFSTFGKNPFLCIEPSVSRMQCPGLSRSLIMPCGWLVWTDPHHEVCKVSDNTLCLATDYSPDACLLHSLSPQIPPRHPGEFP